MSSQQARYRCYRPRCPSWCERCRHARSTWATQKVLPRVFPFRDVHTVPLTILPAISAALTRWRQITAFLLNPSRSERGVIVPEEESLEPRARQLVAEMNTFLGAFIDGKNRQHQQDHLLDVVLECAKFGYSIFSQPADFIWQFGTGGGMDIVVCPGLEKVSDSHGIRCQPEMTITPEVHRV